MDIEGAERGVLSAWIDLEGQGKATPLAFIRQMAVEFHSEKSKKEWKNAAIIAGLTRAGSKLINFEPNLVGGKGAYGKFGCFEVLFRKTELPCGMK